jgi:hypothetical protein
MSTQLSVCGLIVIPGREQQGWECAQYPVTVDVLDLSVALNFARLEVTAEAQANGYTGANMIAASFHPGDPGKCEGLEFADQPVNMDEERERFGGGRNRLYTVCGFYADTWQTYSGVVEAFSPRHAYYMAFDQVQTETGHYLYVANVHEGEVERLAIPGTDRPPAFGDPLATTPAEMEARLQDILGKAA